jgi:hypothetical protein
MVYGALFLARPGSITCIIWRSFLLLFFGASATPLSHLTRMVESIPAVASANYFMAEIG